MGVGGREHRANAAQVINRLAIGRVRSAGRFRCFEIRGSGGGGVGRPGEMK